jgi:hypothetical protein
VRRTNNLLLATAPRANNLLLTTVPRTAVAAAETAAEAVADIAGKCRRTISSLKADSAAD